jgi:hypothetical protein
MSRSFDVRAGSGDDVWGAEPGRARAQPSPLSERAEARRRGLAGEPRVPPRSFCSDVSLAMGEPLAATASRVDHWLLVEYRGLWARDELRESLIPDPVKNHLREQLAAVPRSRLLFVRRPERRRHGSYAVYFGRTSERDPRFYGFEIGGYEELLELDFAAALESGATPLDHPLLVVCTHGKRDPCCARHGRPLYEGLREEAEPGWVWQSTHVGGDRFAGNLVCLPEGLYYGRVRRVDVLPLLDDYLRGEIRLELYRGRCCYPFSVQAAERLVRLETGLRGFDDLRFAGRERLGEEAWLVRFEAGGELHEVVVEASLGDLVPMTCSASTPKRPRRWTARPAGSLRERAS